MGKITGFMEIKREIPSRRPVGERLKDWREFDLKMPEDKLRAQGARCMDCGNPLLPQRAARSATSFPTGTISSYRGRWREANRPAARDQQTFRNSPAGFVLLHAKKPASSTSTTIPSRSN